MHHFNIILTLKVLEFVDTCASADCERCLQLLTDGSTPAQRDHIIVSILTNHGDNKVNAINCLFSSQCFVSNL